MVASTQFLPFATASGANVQSQADYAADSATANGYSNGIADPAKVNKALRQPAFVAAALSTWIAGQLAAAVNDDGVIANYTAQISGALSAYIAALNLAPLASPAFTGAPSLNGAAGTYRQFRYLTGGLSRWTAGISSTAESGANAGSNYALGRNADDGAFIDFPLTISRSTGVSAFLYTPTAPTPAVGDSSTQLATTAFVRANAYGLGQAWSDVTGLRASNTTYTNTSARTITCQVTQTCSAPGYYTYTVAGVTYYGQGSFGTTNGGTVHFNVPPGATYSAGCTAGGPTLVRWAEWS